MTTPDRFVRTHHRRRRHTGLVWAFAFAVLAVALAGADRLGWFRQGLIAGLPCAAVALVLLVLWFVRARRLDPGAIARSFDAEWALQARLEAAHELSSDRTAFAAAQRADTAARVAARHAPRALLWRGGQLALLGAVLLLLVESAVFTVRFLRPTPPPPPVPEDISASIDWRSPDSEIKAAAIEEIPLAASADSRTGFRALTLEISINGEPRLSVPLEPKELQALARPGPHPLKLSLFLDETGAAEYDIVAYHLRADRATRQPAPAVTSPLQFVQIRPAREDAERRKAGPGKGKLGELAALIGNLKAAQLALLKQNFLLAHAPIARTAKAWIETNTTVAADQKTLSAKTAEARLFAIAEALPTRVVDNLTQVIPLMDEAARLIGETQNEPATRPQGRSLALITELEKLIQKILLEPAGGAAGGPPPPKNPDPFKDDQRYKLPPRKDTAAGQLDQLAQDQADQAKKTDPEPADASAPGGKGGEPKPAAADQQELARRAEELAKNQQLSPQAQKAAAQAARDAAAAAAQLKQGDVSAARAPAHAAAETLRAAAAAQEKAGRDAARAQLEAARRELNRAAAETDAATRAAQLAEIAGQLQAGARAQQESGSAEAARQLAAAAAETAQAARAAADPQGGQAGPKPGESAPGDKGEDAAGSSPVPAPGQGEEPGPGGPPSEARIPGPGQGQGKGSGAGSEPGLSPADRAGLAAARAQAALSERAEVLQRAARQLQRGAGTGASTNPGEGSGEGRAGSAGGAAELVLGAQLAHAALAGPESARLAATLVEHARKKAGYHNLVMTPDVRAAADRLLLLLAAARSDDRRDEAVRRFNPEDLDPAYREAIEAYFERLSREARSP